MKINIHPWWYYQYYDSIFSHNRNYLEDIDIISKFKSIKGSVVQEIGAGTGKHSKKILEKQPAELHLIDYDTKSINLLKKKFSNLKHIKYSCADAFKDTSNANSDFDLVISTFSIIAAALAYLVSLKKFRK